MAKEKETPGEPPATAGTSRLDGEPRLLEALERVNRAILAAPALDSMLTGVLDEMLELFACDRALAAVPV